MAGGVWINPNGKWAYVVHVLGRFDLPVTRLEEGWVHTSALSVIDLAAGVRLATVLLDSLTQGAADPWAVIGSADGKTLWISHRGTHEISTLNIGIINELLEGKVPDEIAARKDGARDNIWVRIKNDKNQIKQLTKDLTALHLAGAIRRPVARARRVWLFHLTGKGEKALRGELLCRCRGRARRHPGKSAQRVSARQTTRARRCSAWRNLLPRCHPLLPTLAQLRHVPS